MPMNLVQWEIDVEADSPHAAAQHAMVIQKRPDSTATVFDVIEHDGDGEAIRVDLLESAGERSDGKQTSK